MLTRKKMMLYIMMIALSKTNFYPRFLTIRASTNMYLKKIYSGCKIAAYTTIQLFHNKVGINDIYERFWKLQGPLSKKTA